MQIIPEDIKELSADLEYLLCVKLRPTFLIINYNHLEDCFEILISTIAFNKMKIEERIKNIFNLILVYKPDIIKSKLVVIQAHSSEEINDLLDDIFTKELR